MKKKVNGGEREGAKTKERERGSTIVNTNERVKIARKNRDLKRLSYNRRPGPRPTKKNNEIMKE